MAVEGTFRSFDPLAYYVNNVADLDPSIVKAHYSKDSEAIRSLTSTNRARYHIYICTSRAWHGFVLCVPFGEKDPLGITSDMDKDLFTIPDQLLCWTFELCFEREDLKMYKIRKEFCLFKYVKSRIQKAYFIGEYEDTNPNSLQFASLRAAPHRYGVLLNDCVEFAKEFCICMLSYCSNAKTLEKEVNQRIKQATASGLSVEYLSRKVRPSGVLSNVLLGGTDGSTFFTGRHRIICIILMVSFILIYPVIVAMLVINWAK